MLRPSRAPKRSGVEKSIMATHHELATQAEPVAHEDVVMSYKDAPTRTVSAAGVPTPR